MPSLQGNVQMIWEGGHDWVSKDLRMTHLHLQDNNSILTIEAIKLSQISNVVTTIFQKDISFEVCVKVMLSYIKAFEGH